MGVKIRKHPGYKQLGHKQKGANPGQKLRKK